jgi:hypothetical protein
MKKPDILYIMKNFILKLIDLKIDLLMILRKRLLGDNGPLSDREWIKGYREWKAKSSINNNDSD